MVLLRRADEVKALALAPGCNDTIPAFVVAADVTAPVSRLRVGLEVELLTVIGPHRWVADCTAFQLTAAAVPPPLWLATVRVGGELSDTLSTIGTPVGGGAEGAAVGGAVDVVGVGVGVVVGAGVGTSVAAGGSVGFSPDGGIGVKLIGVGLVVTVGVRSCLGGPGVSVGVGVGVSLEAPDAAYALLTVVVVATCPLAADPLPSPYACWGAIAEACPFRCSACDGSALPEPLPGRNGVSVWPL